MDLTKPKSASFDTFLKKHKLEPGTSHRITLRLSSDKLNSLMDKYPGVPISTLLRAIVTKRIDDILTYE